MKNWFKKKNKAEAPTPMQEEDDDSFKIRKPKEVAERILALLFVIGKVHQGDNKKFIDWIEKNAVIQYLSDNERIFIETNAPTQKQIINFSWRAESLTSLLWSIRLIENMPELGREFDVYSVKGLEHIIHDPIAFMNNIELRPESELREMESELYHEHWRVRDAQLFGKNMPKELNPSVVYERRYALSWLIGYGDDWDSVPTDT